MEKSTIRAFQKVLPSWSFERSENFPEEFAQKRFQKKMEVPNDQMAEDRRSACWDRWLEADGQLPEVRMPSKEWYQARQVVYDYLSNFRLGDVDFTSGSEFTATRGRNSIEAKLVSSDWTCTRDNFDNFVETCYGHKALKRAAKKRFANLVRQKGWCKREVDRYLYSRFSHVKRLAFEIFRAKVGMVVHLVNGSRFSTVPKNNEKDRPINIEPFGNVLFQRRVGVGIRAVLQGRGYDLEVLAEKHRLRIQDSRQATLDLSDASDSNSVSLCEFLLPRWFLQLLHSSRCEMVLGLDRQYHRTMKISSMGNGFTFELMTLFLTAVGTVLDPEMTVFGDDIIIRKDKANRMIELLEEVGFKVNAEKSFVKGPFRESCGANWHDEFGYIRSFDFWYPQTIHDCVVLYNKCHAIARDPLYPSFKKLEEALRRAIPPALRGVWTDYDSREFNGPVTGTSDFLSGYFKCPPKREKVKRSTMKAARDYLVAHQYKSVTKEFFAYRFVEDLRSPNLQHLQKWRWAKYEMYLHAGRRQKDVIKGSGVWVRKLMYVLDGAVTIEARRANEYK
jgi:hypothetical protein